MELVGALHALPDVIAEAASDIQPFPGRQLVLRPNQSV